jgi:hypothetical protein
MVTLPNNLRSCSERVTNSWKERVCFGTISMIDTDRSSYTPPPGGHSPLCLQAPRPKLGLGRMQTFKQSLGALAS